MAAIPSENGDLVRWRLVNIEVNQYDRYDGFADTQALKVFPMSIARAASQRHTEHGHHNSTAILDATFACVHTDMAHPPREIEPDCIVVWLLFKAHSGARKAARLWQEYFCKMERRSDGAKCASQSRGHASTEVRSDRFRVELRIEVFQNVKSMKEYKVDIDVSAIIGTETKIVK